MKKYCLALGLLACSVQAFAAPSAQEILAASDAVRNPEQCFALTTS
jgi:hypothetical protein